MNNTIKWHAPYWLTFDGRKPACMEAPTEDEARADAEALTGHKVLTSKRIPYPAMPRLRAFEHPGYGVVPAFCFRPEQYRGTSCPQNYACTE